MTLIKRIKLSKLWLGIFSAMPARVQLIILIFFLLSLHSLGQTTYSFEISASSSNGYCYSYPIDTYTKDNAVWVGYNQPNPSVFYRYRQAQSYNVSSIPTYGTITSARIEFYSGSTYGAQKGTIALTNISSDYLTQTAETVFGLIRNGTALGQTSISNYSRYSITSSALVQVVQTATQSGDHKIGIGAYNTGEFSNGGTDLFDPWIIGTYTITTPTKPTNLQGTSPTTGSFVLTWNPPTGTVTGYKVYKNGVYYNSTSSPNMAICGLLPGYSYVMTVRPYNTYGDGTLSDPFTQTTHSSAISGDYLICTSKSYSVNEIPPGATITWSTSSTNISVVSGTEHSNPCSFQKVSNGNGTITATISSGCENYSLSYQVHSGPYSSSDYPISGPGSASCNSYVYYSVPSLSGVTLINWSWPTGWTYVSGQNTRYLALRTGTSGGMVAVGVNNDCGQSGSYATLYTSIYGCYSLTVSPNPSSDEVTVTIQEPQTDETSLIVQNSTNLSNEPTVYSFVVTDNMGVVYNTFKKKSKSFKLSVQNLKNGNYNLTGTDGVNKFSTSLVVMH